MKESASSLWCDRNSELEFLANDGCIDVALDYEYLIFGRGRDNSIVSWLCPVDSGEDVVPRVSDLR